MNNKYYYYTNGKKPLQNHINEYLQKRQHDKNLQFVIIASKDFLINKSFKLNFNNLLEELKENNIQPHSVEFAVNDEQRRFSADEWNLFKQFDSFFSKKGINFGFEDMERVWSVQEVENANNNIVKTADEIRKLNLTPYEKLMAAYLKVTSRKYLEETNEEHFSESRSVYGVLNSDRIVCVGFSELLKAIMEEVGDENIKIYTNRVACSYEGKTIHGYHQNLIIHIKDDRYGINGFYYFDPTWDCGHENKSLPHLAYFLVPLKDIDKIKHQIRGEWVGLPRSEKLKENDEKFKKKKINIYNKIRKNYISFTSDGFKLTVDFLKDCITMYPDLENLLRKQVNKEVYEIWTPYYNSLGKNKDLYEQMLDIISQHNINCVSYEDYNNFKTVVNKCINNRNLEEFNNWISNMHENGKKDSCEELIATMRNEFYNNNDYGSYSYYYQEIQRFKTELTLEGYTKYIDECAQKIVDEDPEKLSSLKEDFKKQLMNEWPYENYKEYFQGMINEYQLILNEKMEKFSILEQKLREEFAKNQQLSDSVRYLSDLSKRYHAKNLVDIYENNLDNFDNLIANIINYSKHSVNEFLTNEISTTEADELKTLEFLQSIENKPLEKVFDEFLHNFKGRLGCVDDWFKSKSPTIDINKTITALQKILLKTHKNLPAQDIYNNANRIINETCVIAEEKYENTASNAFVQMANLTRE